MNILRLLICVGLLAAATGAPQAATLANLAVVCEDVAAEGRSFDACPADKAVYKTPASTDLVRDCGTDATCWTAGDVFRKFAEVAVGSTYDACTTPLNDPTRSPSPWTAPADQCKLWKPRVKVATNTNGTITLQWDPVLLCRDDTDGVTKPCNDPAHPDWMIRGYKVLSGVSASSLSLIQTTGPSVAQLTLPGYGDGIYYFAVRAFNGDAKQPDGDLSPVISVTVAKPAAPTASGKAAAPSSVRATVTYP